MKISIIFLFIISFLTVMCSNPRTIYCNGVKNGCYKGCNHKGYSYTVSCKRLCDKDYEKCKKSNTPN